MRGWTVLLAVLAVAVGVRGEKRVVYALNAGGPRVVSSTGVTFAADEDSVTTAYPRGVAAHVPLPIQRAPAQDQALYQTERYAHSTFGYAVPTPAAGDYAMVFKFAEVYWRDAGKKLFDIRINGNDVVRNVDIFGEVGYATAHDVYVPLTFKDGQLMINSQSSPVNDEFRVEFVKKGDFDNPKICAMALVRGSVSDAQKLFPLAALPKAEEEFDEDPDSVINERRQEQADEPAPPASTGDSSRKLKGKLVSQKRKANPYEETGELPLVPIVLALVAIFGLAQVYRMVFA